MTLSSRPTPSTRLVVKLGGSLYSHPQLVPGLQRWLATRTETQILIVTGGGVLADAIRDLDRWQQLGEERSHHFALQATRLANTIFSELTGIPIAQDSWHWWQSREGEPADRPRVQLLDSDAFLTQYELQVAPVPHTWELTTDSIAAYAASVAQCPLVLLKSTDVPPETPWPVAAANGWVDGQFSTLVVQFTLKVISTNFRRWLNGECQPMN